VTAHPRAAVNVENGKATAYRLSYLWLLWLVPLLAMKENAFCKFPQNRACVLSIFWLLCGLSARCRL